MLLNNSLFVYTLITLLPQRAQLNLVIIMLKQTCLTMFLY